jgi:uncharacterized cupin superfamily protein
MEDSAVSSPKPDPVVNIADVPLNDFGNGARFAARLGRVGPIIGAEQLGCALTVVPAGKVAFPFHCHHANEEMAFILSGEGEVRVGEARHPLRAGDVVAMPAGGPEMAHQIVNTSSQELRYLCFSTMRQPEAVQYPDSGKFAVTAGMPAGGSPRDASLRFIGRAASSLDYWDGET